MPITNVDRLEAALDALTRADVLALPAARRRRLHAALGAWAHICGDDLNPLQPKASARRVEALQGRYLADVIIKHADAMERAERGRGDA
jgi:hypothetical protein